MAERLIDLDALALRSGAAAWIEADLDPEPPLLGGEQLAFEATPIKGRVDVSRTTSGYALRLRAGVAAPTSARACSIRWTGSTTRSPWRFPSASSAGRTARASARSAASRSTMSIPRPTFTSASRTPASRSSASSSTDPPTRVT